MADIAVKLKDEFTSKANSMREANVKFATSLDESARKAETYGTKLDALNRKQANLKTALTDAKKALSEAEKAYKQTGDAADSEKLTEAVEKYNNLKLEIKDVAKESSETEKALLNLSEQARKMENSGTLETGTEGGESSGTSGGSGSGDVSTSLLSRISASGAVSQIGETVSNAFGQYIQSAYGDATASAVSTTLSSAATGAAIGTAISPGLGTAVGAIGGAALGVVNSIVDKNAAEDEYFQSSVQDTYESLLESQSDALSAGSETAGQREQDMVAFTQRFGSEEAAQDFLDQVVDMASSTNYAYDEITQYAKSLLNTYSADETLDVLMSLSDAAAGLNLSSSDTSMLITGLSRMRTLDKTTTEYLNYFSERGIDVYTALADALAEDYTGASASDYQAIIQSAQAQLTELERQKVLAASALSEAKSDYKESSTESTAAAYDEAKAAYDAIEATISEVEDSVEEAENGLETLASFSENAKGAVQDMISNGDISGSYAAEVLLNYINEQYGGISETLSTTYDAMTDNLEDAETTLNAAMGEGYNAARKEGLQAQLDYLNSDAGADLEEAYSLIGEFQADLENTQEELIRNAMETVRTGELVGDWSGSLGGQLLSLAEEYDEASLEDDGAEMGRVLAAAQAVANSEYTNSEGYQTMLQSQLDLVDNVQEATSESYYTSGYELGNKLSEGIVDAVKSAEATVTATLQNMGALATTFEADPDVLAAADAAIASGNVAANSIGSSHATGLSYVPYDNYAAILHQGERVLTASEARAADRGASGGNVSVTVNGLTVREETDIDKIAEALARKIQRAQELRG